MWKVMIGALLGALGAMFLSDASVANRCATDSADALSFDPVAYTKDQVVSASSWTDLPNEEPPELQWLVELLNSPQIARRLNPAKNQRLDQALLTLAERAPTATAEIIANSKSPQKDPALRRFVEHWAKIEGTDLIATLPSHWSSDHPELHDHVFRRLAKNEPKVTLPHIMAMPPSTTRTSLLVTISYALEPKELPLLFQALAELTPVERQRFLRSDATELANKAPQQLLEWSRTLNGRDRDLATQAALRGLARTDPEVALAAIGFKPPTNQHDVVRFALRQLAASDLSAATAEAETRGAYFSDVARTWATKNPEAATVWLMTHTPNARNSSHDPLMSLAGIWARQDVDAALAFGEKLPPGVKESWTANVAARLQYDDPKKLEEVATQLADTPYGPEMFRTLALHRYYADPEGTLRQVVNLKPALRDEPLSSLLRFSMDDTPAQAAPLTELITDPDKRMSALNNVLRRWGESDNNAMEHWLDNEASATVRDEALATLAYKQPHRLTAIKSRPLRVAAYLRRQHQPNSTADLLAVLNQIQLTEAQWQSLDAAALTSANSNDS